MTAPTFLQIGDWTVNVGANRLEGDGAVVSLEPRMMAVLTQLSRHAGEVVSADSLLLTCWAGEALGDNPVHKVIAGLRKALGDTAKAPSYIETIRKRGYRLVAPVRVLSAEGPRGLRDSWRGRSPFRGLAAFEREHADVFFGRGAEVVALRQRLASQWARGHPLVVVLGASGSGKTSLVQAGLVPAMVGAADGAAQDGLVAGVAVATADLGSAAEIGLLPTLAGALLDWDWGDEALLAGWSVDSLATALSKHPDEVAQALELRLRSLGALGSCAAPLLVIDRLEALFLLPDADEQRRFVELIAGWVQARLVMVLALCRNDFYARLADHPALMHDKEHGAHFDLAPPGAEAVAQIIRLPAQAAGLRFGLDPSGMNRLDDRLHADALHAVDGLPLLQYALQQLYLRREAGEELSWAAYEAMGGLEGAIGQVAEATLTALPAPQQQALGELLPRLVGLSREDSSPTGRWLPAAELEGDAQRGVVAALVQARLLVADHHGGAPGCRVAHEALLRRWPRVTGWVAQHRAALTLRDELQAWVQRWQDGGRAAALLLPRGGTLWQASEAMAAQPKLFDQDEREFVGRSVARSKRQARLRLLGLAGTSALALVAVLAAVRSTQLADLARQREAQSRSLSSFMLGKLTDQLRPLGKLSLLSSIAEEALKILGDNPPDESDADKMQRAKMLYLIGEVHGVNGKQEPEKAHQSMEAAEALLKTIQPGPTLDTDEYYRFRTRVADKLGAWALGSGDAARAESHYLEWQRLSRLWLAARPGEFEALLNQAYALSVLAETWESTRGLKASEGAHLEARAMFREVMKLRPNDRHGGLIQALHLRTLGTTFVRLGKVRDSLDAFDEALGWFRQRAQVDPSDMEVTWWMAFSEYERAFTALDAGLPRAAVQADFDQAIQHVTKVTRFDPDTAKFWGTDFYELQRLGQLTRMGVDTGKELVQWRQAYAVKPSASASDAATPNHLMPDWRAIWAMRAMARGAPEADQLMKQVSEELVNSMKTNGYPHPLTSLVIERLRTLRRPADPHLRGLCKLAWDKLSAEIQAGFEGPWREEWLIMGACKLPLQLDAETWRKLTAGGYVPRWVTPETMPSTAPKR